RPESPEPSVGRGETHAGAVAGPTVGKRNRIGPAGAVETSEIGFPKNAGTRRDAARDLDLRTGAEAAFERHPEIAVRVEVEKRQVVSGAAGSQRILRRERSRRFPRLAVEAS